MNKQNEITTSNGIHFKYANGNILFFTTNKLSWRKKMVIAVICFEATNSVFDITAEDNRFSISTLGLCNSEYGEKPIDRLNNYQSLDLKMILSYMLKKLRKEVLE